MGVDTATYRARIGCCPHNNGHDVIKVIVTVHDELVMWFACLMLALLLGVLTLSYCVQYFLNCSNDFFDSFAINSKAFICLCYGYKRKTRSEETLIGAVCFIQLLLLIAGVEQNPGPQGTVTTKEKTSSMLGPKSFNHYIKRYEDGRVAPTGTEYDQAMKKMRRIVQTWENDEKFFVETKATKCVTNRLRDSNILTIAGCSGCGKSFAMHHAALTLQKEGFSLYVIKTFSEVNQYMKKGKNQIFMIDDPIGCNEIDYQKLKEWQIWSGSKKFCMTESIKLVMTIHTDIMNCIISRSALIHNSEIVDLDFCLLSMPPIDQLKFFEQACHKKDIETDRSSIYELIQSCDIQNYPLTVYLYCSDKYFQQHPSQLSKGFFRALECRLDHLFEFNRALFSGLVLCAVFHEKLSIETFNRFSDKETPLIRSCRELLYALDLTSPLPDIGDELKKLEEIYVVKTTQFYTFKHSEFRRIVQYVVGKRYGSFPFRTFNALVCLKACRLSRESCHVCNVYTTLISGVRAFERAYMVVIETTDECHLATAFIRFIANNEDIGKNVFESDFCQDEQFLYHMYMEIKSKHISEECKEKILKQLLCNACLYNFEDLIRQLMEEKIEYNNRSLTGITPLAACAFAGDVEHLKVFIDHCCDINVEFEGYTPLGLAISNKQIAAAQFLIKNNCDVNLGYHTPLSISAKNCDKQALKLLLDHGARINNIDGFGFSPLAYAVNFMLEHYVDVNICGNSDQALTTLTTASGAVDVVDRLLEEGAAINTIDAMGRTPLTQAILMNAIGVVNYLINENAIYDEDNEVFISLKSTDEEHTTMKNMVHTETEIKETSSIEKLADMNISDDKVFTPTALPSYIGYIKLFLLTTMVVNKHGGRTSNENARFRNSEVVDLLLRYKADVNICGDGAQAFTPLTAASATGNLHIAEKLLKNGAAINQCDGIGRTPLTTAIFRNLSDVVDVLLLHKADVNMSDNRSFSPLAAACVTGSVDILTRLIHEGVDVNKYDGTGRIPLTRAILMNETEVVKTLLENKADVNMHGREAFTPLTAACWIGDKTIVETLLKEEANVDLCDGIGRTPLNSAIFKDNIEIVHFLIENKADVRIPCNIYQMFNQRTESNESVPVDTLKRRETHNNKKDGMSSTIPIHSSINSKETLSLIVVKNQTNHMQGNVDAYNTNEDVLKQEVKPTEYFHETSDKQSSDTRKNVLMDLISDGRLSNSSSMRRCTRRKRQYTTNAFIDESSFGNGEKLLPPSPKKYHAQNHSHQIKACKGDKCPLEKESGKQNLVHRFTTESYGQQAKQLLNAEDVYHNFTNEQLPTYNSSKGYEQKGFQQIQKLDKNISDDAYETLVQSTEYEGNDKYFWNHGDTILHGIIRYCTKDRIKLTHLCLQHGANAGITNDCGEGLLHYCALYGTKESVELAELLIKHGADTECKTRYGESALHYAVANQKNETIKLLEILIAHGASVNCNNHEGESLLHHVIKWNGPHTISLAQFLLDHGASANVINLTGESVLHYIAMWDIDTYLRLVEVFVNHGANVNIANSNGETPLHYIARYGTKNSTQLAKILLQHGAEVGVTNSFGEGLLHYTSRYNNKHNLELAKLFINHGYSLDNSNQKEYLPHNNIYHELKPNKQFSESTNENRCTNKESDSLRLCAIRCCNDGDLQKVKLLIKQELSINKVNDEGENLLHCFIRYCSKFKKEAIEMCLKNGIKVNSVNKKGESLLHYCSLYGADDSVELAEVLIKYGVDIECTNRYGETVLHYTVANQNDSTVKLSKVLLANGASATCYNHEGESLLHYVAKWNGKQTINLAHLYLDYGVSANTINLTGESVLHYTAMWGIEKNVELAKIMIENGAKVNAINSSGQTPLQYVRFHSNKSSVMFEEIFLSNAAVDSTLHTTNQVNI